ncbi:uncharacterized protein BX664DRAFT_309992 [Halteromyces radiatus]|uniref:uncharacterized protein n=1 Tax=Halteromyces radiatus TaxID=101107 RepID=UPI00221FD980|nr:uncharacterized protein BX664DRAFT_309992 [Halteromyces radiatus]KAI8098974.1 hypothetical protein BX664DRAFT_309992 [Halteromyces radiatus]
MPLSYLSNVIHPPSGSSEQPPEHRNIYFLQRRWANSYAGCKYLALGLNMIYIIRTFNSLHESGTAAVNAGRHGKQTPLMIQAIFQLFIYALMLICLIMDIVVISTRKLSIADWFWRPGIIYFVLATSDQSIRLLNYLTTTQYSFEICQEELGPFIPLPLAIHICELRIQLNCITGGLRLCRDILIGCVYVFSVHYYVTHLISELKLQENEAVSMNNVTTYHHDLQTTNQSRNSNEVPMTEPFVVGGRLP